MKAKSIKGKSPEEIKTALAQSIQDGYKPTLAFVFLTDLAHVDAISALLNAEGIAIFGASTSEKFSDQGIEPDGIVVMLLDMNIAHFRIILKDFEQSSVSVYESACEIGQAAIDAFDRPAFIISAADYRTPGHDVIKGLIEKAGADVKVTGGMAGELLNFTGCVFTNGAKTSKGLIALILDENKIDVKGIAVSGWKPVGTVKTITKSNGPWIYTIDNEPAMHVIKKFLGNDITIDEKSEGLVSLNINYPLQIHRESGPPMMRPTLLWNTEDQSVMLGGLVKEGATFRFSLPPDLEVIDTVIDSAKEIRDKELPEADAMLIFSCIGRLTSLGPLLPTELEGLAGTWNTPMAGFFSLGEFGKLDDSPPEMHGTTVSWVALKEK
ncbi:MAG: FIST C-terminal domain-containing protein [Flavisolibacter sp.]|nr:FIST C-terminal domain-containing protein [Flavisolibacter sp.]